MSREPQTQESIQSAARGGLGRLLVKAQRHRGAGGGSESWGPWCPELLPVVETNSANENVWRGLSVLPGPAGGQAQPSHTTASAVQHAGTESQMAAVATWVDNAGQAPPPRFGWAAVPWEPPCGFTSRRVIVKRQGR